MARRPSKSERNLRRLINTERLSHREIRARSRAIHRECLRDSEHLDGGNFTVISEDDLERMFDLYDARFFGGGCRRLLGRDDALCFGLSDKLVRVGARTRWDSLDLDGEWLGVLYKISVSTRLLFGSYLPGDPTIADSRDRLEGLQRLMEHERASNRGDRAGQAPRNG